MIIVENLIDRSRELSSIAVDNCSDRSRELERLIKFQTRKREETKGSNTHELTGSSRAQCGG